MAKYRRGNILKSGEKCCGLDLYWNRTTRKCKDLAGLSLH